jgi:hypothetical protein
MPTLLTARALPRREAGAGDERTASGPPQWFAAPLRWKGILLCSCRRSDSRRTVCAKLALPELDGSTKMDLANMRENGRAVAHGVLLGFATTERCSMSTISRITWLCRRSGRDMVCTRCGIIGADARPNWQEQPPRESLTGVQWRS